MVKTIPTQSVKQKSSKYLELILVPNVSQNYSRLGQILVSKVNGEETTVAEMNSMLRRFVGSFL